MPDILDVLAVMLGVLYAVRKLSVARRKATDFPEAARVAFEVWRKRALTAYNLLSSACFAKVALDLLWTWRGMSLVDDFSLYRYVGMAIDGSWLVALFVGMSLRAKAGKLQLALQRAAEAEQAGAVATEAERRE